MVKIDIFSGFLGAGKTTLIKKLLNECFEDEKVVLIENEYGEVGIDGGFLKDSSIEIKEINSGCICCSLKGDFEEALKQVIETLNPDRILIEPSGVGKLSDVESAINNIEGVVINSATAIVDVKKATLYSKNFGEFYNDQISEAKCIILSKTQDAEQDKVEEVFNYVKELNPNAKIIATDWNELDAKTMLKTMEENTHKHDETCSCGCNHEHHHHNHDEHDHHHKHDESCECGHHHEHDESCECGHHHEHGEGCGCSHHDHDHHHAEDVFTSVGFETVRKYTKEEIESILGNLDEHILRAKGIVQNSAGGWLFFDYVPGDIDVREGSAAVVGMITVIGDKVDEEKVKELFLVK